MPFSYRLLQLSKAFPAQSPHRPLSRARGHKIGQFQDGARMPRALCVFKSFCAHMFKTSTCGLSSVAGSGHSPEAASDAANG